MSPFLLYAAAGSSNSVHSTFRNHADCVDEFGCNETKVNGKSSFSCKNGRKIPASKKCDLVDDCGDLSDEVSSV